MKILVLCLLAMMLKCDLHDCTEVLPTVISGISYYPKNSLATQYFKIVETNPYAKEFKDSSFIIKAKLSLNNEVKKSNY